MLEDNLTADVQQLRQELANARSEIQQLKGQLDTARILTRNSTSTSERYLLRSVLYVEHVARIVDIAKSVPEPTCPWCEDKEKVAVLEKLEELTRSPRGKKA